MKKQNKTSTDKKLKDIYSFLDDKEKPKSEDLLQYFKEEKDTITKEDIINDEKEIKPIPIEKVTKEKYVTTTIDDDIKQDVNIIQDKNHSDLMKAFESLSNPTNMESNTILTNNQVIALSTINYLAQVYDIEFYKQFIKIFPSPETDFVMILVISFISGSPAINEYCNPCPKAFGSTFSPELVCW